MKLSKALLVAAPALGLATAAAFVLRAGDAPVPPSAWIVAAAAALNGSSPGSGLHAAVAAPADASQAARRFALEGQRLRVQRRFAEAADRFRDAVAADPSDADSWADLADCMAAAAGRDLSGSRAAIERSLALDPGHRKALWLRASLELQEREFAAAAATWRELARLVPDGSTDARVIAANISEADMLARGAGDAGGTGP